MLGVGAGCDGDAQTHSVTRYDVGWDILPTTHDIAVADSMSMSVCPYEIAYNAVTFVTYASFGSALLSTCGHRTR